MIDVKTRRVAKRIKITAQEPRAIKVKNDKLYVIPFESNNRTQLSGGVGKPHDGDLVTFDARKLASAFDSVGFTVDVIKHPEVPDKDLFIFDTINEKPLRTFKSLGKKFILSINLNYSLNFFWIKLVIFSSDKSK